MASARMTAWVEGDEPNMTLELLLSRPDIKLHDEDSERTFLFQAIIAMAEQVKENLVEDLPGT